MLFPISFDKLRIKKVLIMLPLHREGLTSYLSPLLGQYGIRNIDFVTTFVNTFNAKTENIFATQISTDDLELGLSDELFSVPIYLTVYKNGKYVIDTGYSLIGSVYNLTFKKRRRFFRGGKSYRNYKKLLQLSVFYRYLTSTATLNELEKTVIDFNDPILRENYMQIRNSLHRKR